MAASHSAALYEFDLSEFAILLLVYSRAGQLGSCELSNA